MSVRWMNTVWDHAPYKGAVLLVLLGLSDHANDDGECYPKMEKIAAKARVSKRRAQQIVNETLVPEGWLIVELNGGRGDANLYRVVRPRDGAIVGVKPVAPPTDEGCNPLHPGGEAGCTPGVKPAAPLYVEPSEESSEEPPEERKPDLQIVWDHYVRRFNSRAVLDDKRRRIIRNALKVRTVEQCCRAIDGLSVSPFHNGDNEQKRKYLDLHYALAGKGDESNDTRIDKMIEFAERYAKSIGTTDVTIELSRREKRWRDEVNFWLGGGGMAERGQEALTKLREAGFKVTKNPDNPKVIVLERGT